MNSDPKRRRRQPCRRVTSYSSQECTNGETFENCQRLSTYRADWRYETRGALERDASVAKVHTTRAWDSVSIREYSGAALDRFATRRWRIEPGHRLTSSKRRWTTDSAVLRRFDLSLEQIVWVPRRESVQL
jgi:hypothetical protein